MSFDGTADPRYEPTIVRASAVSVSGVMTDSACGDGSPTVTVLPPTPVALNAVSNALGWPAASMTMGAFTPFSSSCAGV